MSNLWVCLGRTTHLFIPYPVLAQRGLVVSQELDNRVCDAGFRADDIGIQDIPHIGTLVSECCCRTMLDCWLGNLYCTTRPDQKKLREILRLQV